MGAAKLLKALTDALNNREEKVPVGWFKTRDLSKVWGTSLSYTGKLIVVALKSGSLEQRKFRIRNGSRGVYPVAHYRPTK